MKWLQERREKRPSNGNLRWAVAGLSRRRRSGSQFLSDVIQRLLQPKEESMFLPKSDIFADIRQEAIDDLTKLAIEETHDRGTVLFAAGDPATYFYLLVEGTVSLSIGDGAASHYLVNRIGETFGWSSVVGRKSYSARAECSQPSKVIKISSDDLEKVFDSHARSGRVFYRRLAAALGQRWLDTHAALMSELQPKDAQSFGTGQVINTSEG